MSSVDAEEGRGNRFDEFARALAGGPISRRTALGRIGGTLAAVGLWHPGGAFARSAPKPRRKHCPAHRVHCGKRCCATGAHCTHGHCVCPGGSVVCGTGCVHVGRDPHNCGHCGHRCGSGESCGGGLCVSHISAPTCSDQVRNGMETDVDCGGPFCPRCADGNRCAVGSDCTSGFCAGGRCMPAPATCSDGVRDGTETDVDCGGPTCAPCANEKRCGSAGDCQSGYCNSAGLCATPTCSDGARNGTETDVDCGGASCPACAVGKRCHASSDCVSGYCNSGGVCATATCNDGARNGTETDVDCGGPSCPACADGKGCTLDRDCISGVCTSGMCVAESCVDGVKNATETDIDCGGACAPCANGKHCSVAGDCASGYCNTTTGLCATPTCNDGVKNGSETGVDCGGPTCPKCAGGQVCVAGSDCVSGVCSNGTCATGSCADGVQNGSETDIDCGGSTCPKCAVGRSCRVAGDCLSGVCGNGTCQPPQCNDAIKNGSETDTDCGGTCPGCPAGKACGQTDDCAAGLVCAAGFCARPPASCSNNVLDPGETAVDCGGPNCPQCAAGKSCKVPADCLSGVCSSGVCQSTVCEPGHQQPCYPGPNGTQGVGICHAGTQTCASDGSGYGPCTGAVTPQPEVCNGRDDNCNGIIDDNVTDPWIGQRMGHGTPRCVGGSRTDVCDSGYLTCATACDCQGTACCGSSCQTQHSTGAAGGAASVFYDCTRPGVYTQTLATNACAAYTGDATKCAVKQCAAGGGAVCSTGTADCVCWGYGGVGQGHVRDPGSGTCACPTINDPSWA